MGKRLAEVEGTVIETREDLQKATNKVVQLDDRRSFLAGKITESEDSLISCIEFLQGMVENNGDEVERDLNMAIASLKAIRQNLIATSENKQVAEK